ncbi:hypothetical protein [Candidatus Endoriftia persephonae]|jgi:hypothetical protein|uniref:MotA/TolQ/ExbB proton channel domain-containing protein n=2 Tax=Gammaproteobacteria TaxID=1236 RepID=G2FCA9_9GAMM|nr:hypothetical protein [Candidatus Endoriftia persephone]EGW55472.1 hypothetical protein TevJSym_ac00350 [endosymbiont of Tevnia jerichonana (vent Tica)]USF86628.1 hypothetical protein L0Y14_10815 [Candidatus Endoriftia persephone]
MNQTTTGHFLKGFAAGGGVTLLLGASGLYLASLSGAISIDSGKLMALQQWLDWLNQNLGSALLPFSLIALLFLVNLTVLKQKLQRGDPPEQVAQTEHLLDVWTGLFFGIGVIWTAIGMRGALLQALGDPTSSAQLGAFVILQRLVDGGILLALSTTIFGGIGGYLMRLIKALSVGGELRRFYLQHHAQQSDSILLVLQRIEQQLESMGNKDQTDHVPKLLEHRAH